MGRAPCCSKVGLRRGAWSSDEDELLIDHIQTHGEGNWRALPSKAGLLRCGKSCRLRWMNYLRPGIKRGNFTSEENDVIIRLRSLHGNRWSVIAAELPGRTDNEIKNHWNSLLSKVAENTDSMHMHDPKASKSSKKTKKKRNQKAETATTEEKSKKVKVLDNSSSSCSSTLLSSSSSKNESFNHGMGSGASSSCMFEFDFVDNDFDFFWSNWTPFLDVEDTNTNDGHQDESFLTDGCDFCMSNDDENLLLEKLYHEYLNLLNHEDVNKDN